MTNVNQTGVNQAADAAKSAEPPPSATPTTLSGRHLAGAAVIVMIFFVFSRVAGLAREIVIGASFGTSSALDAYLAAFRVPDLLFQLVAGGALGSAFIPTFATYWAKAQYDEAWLLFSRVVNLVTMLLVLIATVVILFAQPLVSYVIAPGFPPDQQILTVQLMRWMLLSTIIFGASGLIMGALNATQHFLLPAAAPVFYNVAIILGAYFLSPRIGINGLVIGVVAGAFCHLLVQLPGLWRAGARYRFAFALRDNGVRQVMRLMGPRTLGLFFVQMHFLVNTILASGLAAGRLSALNYAWLLMLLPQGVFAQSIATAIFPTFAAQVAAGQVNAMRHSFGQIIRTVLFLTIPAAAGLFLLRVPLVTLLLQRREFTSESTALVAYALQFYAIGLVAHAVVEIAVRAFYALHDTWTPVLVGIGAMVLNILFSMWWVQSMEHGGLALANSIATSLEMLLLLWLLRTRIGGIDGRRLGMAVARHLLATAIMAAAIIIVWQWLLPAAVGQWVLVITLLPTACLVYLACVYLFGSEELLPVIAVIRRRR